MLGLDGNPDCCFSHVKALKVANFQHCHTLSPERGLTSFGLTESNRLLASLNGSFTFCALCSNVVFLLLEPLGFVSFRTFSRAFSPEKNSFITVFQGSQIGSY